MNKKLENRKRSSYGKIKKKKKKKERMWAREIFRWTRNRGIEEGGDWKSKIKNEWMNEWIN